MRIVIFSILFFLVVTTCSVHADIGPGLNQQSPGFRLTDIKNKSVSLAEMRQNGHVLLIFWSTRCTACLAMLPQMKALHAQYKNKKITIAAINVGYENHDEVVDYVAKHKIEYLVLNQDDQKEFIAQVFDLKGTPTVKLVDTNGTILYDGHALPDVGKWVK